MDIDFHFDATFVAAILAGFTPSEASTIAHAGQYIDDSDEDRVLDRSGMFGLQAFATALPTSQLLKHAMHSSFSETTIRLDRQMWTAFHFLPGNLDLRKTYEGVMSDSGFSSSFHYDALAKNMFRSMCLPDSPLVIEMVDDTTNNHKTDLHMIGIRMHALIDTFAHMLYCGSAAWHVNEVGQITEYQPAGSDSWVQFEIAPLEYAPPGAFYDSISYTGHGRMGHIPDYPWVKYRYKPQWSREPIVKDNPVMYMRAFEEMTHAMSCIRLNKRYTPNTYRLMDGLRAVVDGLIRTPHPSNDLFSDWTDLRRQNWWDGLEALRRCASQSDQTANLANLPHLADYPAYGADAWIDGYRKAEGEQKKRGSDYYRFHLAAFSHVEFVIKTVNAAGLPILGPAPVGTQFKVKCLDAETKKVLGYFGDSGQNYVHIASEVTAALCEFTYEGGALYLKINNSTVDRWLGNYGGWADWGTRGGYYNQIAVKDDNIYIATEPNTWLWWDNDNFIKWTGPGGKDNLALEYVHA